MENNTNNTIDKKRSIEEDQENNNEQDDEFDVASMRSKKKQNVARKDCPYLDTVNRNILDFDFEKICSISFHNHNVYACLVCGKYFQGKSQDSHANLHCLQTNHHVFINLHNEKIYCLPDDYEVIDSSLDDIKYLLNPTYTKQQIENLDKNSKYSRALDATQYLPGIIGLNNIKNASFVNVIIQSLARIPYLRDYFLDLNNIKNNKSILINSFSELLRKLWNPKNFKTQLSPHEFLQAIQNKSNKKFSIGVSSDPLEFLQWLLNTFHTELGGTKKPKSSIIQKAFSGLVEITTETPIKKKSTDDNNDKDEKQDDDKTTTATKTTITTQPFLYLLLDLPPKPVFKDEMDKSIIPQVPLFNLLSKYDGVTPTTLLNGEVKRYKLLELPNYLILCVKRFSKNNFFLEKEPTIVNFPLKNLDLTDYLPKNTPASKYNLLSTIKHEGQPNSGTFSVYVWHKGSDKWFEIQDLTYKETIPQLIAVSECYLLIYEKVVNN
ncbi:hypothetical protein CYY_006571 [Polysphondylium violaceum]|uniref:Uncharacterized protein n=1 Tax=Polysphondylium violaceum TaxID=133409 RepID=A0A8J4PS20_9MYCE|nr:hypothetical protein CYY_006571 [Polysphondylium violaceum]